MATFVDFVPGLHEPELRSLLTAYLREGAPALKQAIDVEEDIPAVVADDLMHLNQFAPPTGRLLLVVEGTDIVGTGSLRTICLGVGEVKRMYIQPAYRGLGLGRSLLQELLITAEGRALREVRLDTHPGVMPNAIMLYRSFGFEDCDPYPESEIPEEFHDRWIFMRKRIGSA